MQESTDSGKKIISAMERGLASDPGNNPHFNTPEESKTATPDEDSRPHDDDDSKTPPDDRYDGAIGDDGSNLKSSNNDAFSFDQKTGGGSR